MEFICNSSGLKWTHTEARWKKHSVQISWSSLRWWPKILSSRRSFARSSVSIMMGVAVSCKVSRIYFISEGDFVWYQTSEYVKNMDQYTKVQS